MRIIIVSIIFIYNCFFGFAQNKDLTDSLLKELQKSKKDIEKVKIYNELSWNYINFNFDLSIKYAQEALDLAQKINNNEGIALAYTHIAYASCRKGDFNEALININKGIGIYEILGKSQEVAKSLLTVSQIYFARSKFDEALEYSKKALQMKQDIGDSTSMELNYLTIGVIYEKQGNYSLAFENYLKSVDYCLKNKNKNTLASNYNNIAVIYRKQNKNELALEYYEKAVGIYKKTNNKLGKAQTINNIAVVYEAEGMFETALKYYSSALDIFFEIGYKQGQITSLTNIAGIELNLGNFEDVPNKLSNAQKIAEDIDDDGKLISIYGLWGQYYLEIKNFENAVYFTQKAIDLSLKINALDIYKDLCLQISIIYEGNGNYQKSLENFKIYHQFSDSLFNIEKTTIIENLNADFQLSEKQNELELKNKEVEILEKNKKIYQFRIIFVVLVLLVVVLFTFYVISNYKKKISRQKILLEKEKEIQDSEKRILELKILNQDQNQKNLEAEIKYKNQEIKNFAYHIIDKNEFINNLKNQLKSALKNQNDKESNSQIQTIINNINSKMILEKDREEFLAYIDQINDNFYYKLNQNYPDLTETEVRIASLLRMDFSSKDIAAILHITPKSVDTNRYRIRKKVNLDSDEKLNNFFKSI